MLKTKLHFVASVETIVPYHRFLTCMENKRALIGNTHHFTSTLHLYYCTDVEIVLVHICL